MISVHLCVFLRDRALHRTATFATLPRIGETVVVTAGDSKRMLPVVQITHNYTSQGTVVNLDAISNPDLPFFNLLEKEPGWETTPL